jgi:surface polysaccharide O-acyltransferase-like enzyme
MSDADAPSPADAVLRPSTAIANLRVAVTLLVVAQHAVLAYHPFAPAPQPALPVHPRTWLTFPVLDDVRTNAFVVMTAFNDVFGMALMFLLSGLFVSSSLRRKGARTFLRDRLVRLGVPFVVAAVVLTPLAYYPSYLVTTDEPRIAGFLEVWWSMGWWPGGAGPAWFLWMLLVFDALAAVLYVRGATPFLVGGLGAVFRRVILLSIVAYVPMAIAFGPETWAQMGPFKMQASRETLYLLYFLVGAGIGATSLDRGMLAVDGPLARGWLGWVGAATACFLVYGVVALRVGGLPTHLAFVGSCAASTFAVLAVFVRFVHARSPIARTLAVNAYAIYVVHYVYVTWLQYALRPAALPAVIKATVVLFGAIAASWATAVLLRRVPGVARFV